MYWMNEWIIWIGTDQWEWEHVQTHGGNTELFRTEPKDCINADIVMSCQIFHSSCNIMAENSRANVLT